MCVTAIHRDFTVLNKVKIENEMILEEAFVRYDSEFFRNHEKSSLPSSGTEVTVGTDEGFLQDNL